MRPDKCRAPEKQTPWGNLVDKAEQPKASVRAKAEHPFRISKRRFGFTKVRYKELDKNTAQLVTLFELGNVWIARKRILRGAMARVRPESGHTPANGYRLQIGFKMPAIPVETQVGFHCVNL